MPPIIKQYIIIDTGVELKNLLIAGGCLTGIPLKDVELLKSISINAPISVLKTLCTDHYLDWRKTFLVAQPLLFFPRP